MSIRSGFFNSVKVGTTYDRAYNADDHNKYFKGLVAQNGVYYHIDQLFELDPTVTEYTVPVEIDGQDRDNMIGVIVHPGKAMVNGHWVISDADEVVYCEPRPLGQSYTRIDMVVLRWSAETRDVSLLVKSGVPTTTPNYDTQNGYPEQYGYIPDPRSELEQKDPPLDPNLIDRMMDHNSDVYFEPVTVDEEEVLEICLGYIHIPSVGDITVENTGGTNRCPWIAQILGGYDDSFVAQYNTAILEWWNRIKEEGDIYMNLNVFKKKFVGNAEHTQSSTLDLSDIPGYLYENTDTFHVYYNGLFMDSDEYRLIFGENDAVSLQIYNGFNYIPEDNSVIVEIFKGEAVDIPDGNSIKY